MKIVNRLRMMFKQLASAIFLVVGSVALFGNVNADNHDDDTFDIAEITCWELGSVEAVADRTSVLMMVYGYVSGVHELKKHSGTKIGPAVESVRRLCQANPDMFVAAAMERVLLED